MIDFEMEKQVVVKGVEIGNRGELGTLILNVPPSSPLIQKTPQVFIIRGNAKGGEDYFRIEFHQILSFRKDATYIHIYTFHGIVFGLFDADFPAISSQDSEPRPSETIVQGLTSIPVRYFAAGCPLGRDLHSHGRFPYGTGA